MYETHDWRPNTIEFLPGGDVHFACMACGIGQDSPEADLPCPNATPTAGDIRRLTDEIRALRKQQKK